MPRVRGQRLRGAVLLETEAFSFSRRSLITSHASSEVLHNVMRYLDADCLKILAIMVTKRFAVMRMSSPLIGCEFRMMLRLPLMTLRGSWVTFVKSLTVWMGRVA